MQASNRKRALSSGYHQHGFEAKKNRIEFDDSLDEYCSQVLEQQQVTSTVKSLNIRNQQQPITNRNQLAQVKEYQEKKFFKSRSVFPKNTPSATGKKLQPSSNYHVAQRTPNPTPVACRPSPNISKSLHSSVKSQGEITGFISQVSATRCGDMDTQPRSTQKNPKQQQAYKKKLEADRYKSASIWRAIHRPKTEESSADASHFDVGQFFEDKVKPLQNELFSSGHRIPQFKLLSFINSLKNRLDKR